MKSVPNVNRARREGAVGRRKIKAGVEARRKGSAGSQLNGIVAKGFGGPARKNN